MKRVRLKKGDIFRIPLNNDLYGYLQFVREDKSFLCLDLVRVFDLKINNLKSEKEPYFLENLINSTILFYKYAYTIAVGVKIFEWEKIGNISIENSFVEPSFLSRELFDINDIDNYHWYLNQNSKKKHLGKKLPKEYYNLPFQSGTNPKTMTEIIELGYDKYNFTKKYLESEN